VTISVAQSNDLNGSGTSLAFGSNVTALDTVFLVVIVYANSNVTLSVTSPTLGGSAVPGAALLQSEQVYDSGTGHAAGHFTFMLPDCPGGSSAVGWTAGGSTSVDGAAIYDVAGLGPRPVLDQQAAGSGSGTAVASGATPAILASPEFILGAAAMYQGDASGPGGGWTTLEPNNSGWAGYQIATSAGGTYSWSQTQTSSDAWTAGIVTVAPGPAASRPLIVSQAVKRAAYW
jgi:hypothetical protein